MADEDPVVARRHLRMQLKNLRKDRDETVVQVAGALDWSHSKLVRIEQGEVGISPTDLRALLTYYGVVDPATVAVYVQQAKLGRRQPYAEYSDVLSRESRGFFLLQERSIAFLQFDPVLIPGLLQTEGYARAVIMAFRGPQEPNISQFIDARLERQEKVLGGSSGPEMHVVLDESALRRWVGTAPGQNDVMSGQLRHLKELSRHPRVHIQIAPYSVGIYAALRAPFVILELPASEPGGSESVLYLETRKDMMPQDKADDLAEYAAFFYDLQKLSLPEGETVPFLDRVLAEIARTT
jgi:transcriptional regulator with XRE-family HTH domain